MIGFSTVVDLYRGYEPSTRTHAGLVRLAAWLRQFRTDFVGVVDCIPYEDGPIDVARYDFALTSPPYYDTEKYTTESTNSMNRYTCFADWCAGFYHPLIVRTMQQLRRGTPFVLNIGSRTYPLADQMRKVAVERGYTVRTLGGLLSHGEGHAAPNGAGRTGEGETFYEIRDNRA